METIPKVFLPSYNFCELQQGTLHRVRGAGDLNIAPARSPALCTITPKQASEAESVALPSPLCVLRLPQHVSLPPLLLPILLKAQKIYFFALMPI